MESPSSSLRGSGAVDRAFDVNALENELQRRWQDEVPPAEGVPGGFLQRNLFHRARDRGATRGRQGAAAPGAGGVRIPVAQFERGN